MIATPDLLRPRTSTSEAPVFEDLTPVHPVDQAKAEQAVRMLLEALGENPQREGLLDTPRRVAKAMAELMSGRFVDPGTHLQRIFSQHCDEMVLLRDIELFSLCEHHLLPFIGRVHLAYLPDGNSVVGLSKLARLVETFARRPQLQERLTNQIADALQEHLNPRGVAVFVQAEHLCMKMRGVSKTQAVMQTFALRGEFRNNPARRAEVLQLLGATAPPALGKMD